MKRTFHILSAAVLLGLTTLVAQNASAQSVVETATTAPITSMGTIGDFGPNTMTVRTESSSAPVSYRYSKSTTYVDEAGNPVSMETVKSGLPVTVYYTQDGDNMMASKVVVRKTTTTTTTTTQP